MKEKSIQINGEARTVCAGSVRELLAELGYDADGRGIAVALNDVVLSRGRWAEQPLSAGDSVEIVGAVQGG